MQELELTLIIKVIGIILIFIGTLTIVKARAYDDFERNKLLTYGVTIFLGAMILLVGANRISTIITYGSTDEFIKLETQRNEYTVYLDGNEVDNDKIDLSLYTVRYDDEEKVAYATTKQRSDYIPVFIPWNIK